jgi:hypothetical protein
MEGGDDLAGPLAAGQRDGSLREATVDFDAEERGDALDQHVLVEREDPKWAVLAGETRDALEVLQAFAKGIAALDLPPVEKLVDHLGQVGVERMVGLGESRASVVEVARLDVVEQDLVVELGRGEELRYVRDDFVGMAGAACPPGVVQPPQRGRPKPGEELGVDFRAQGHAQFA